MGASSSRFSSEGTLKGAFAPPLPNVVLPQKLDPQVAMYSATIPLDQIQGSDKTIVDVKGRNVTVTIPKLSNGKLRKNKPGDTFTFVYGDRERVIASTLPTLPGTIIVVAKPILWANASHVFNANSFNDQKGQMTMSKKVGDLLQHAQTNLLQKAVEEGCNAVLSIQSNISTDSSGGNGSSKIVIVMLIGTPCVVMPMSEMPVVQAEAAVIPSIKY